LTCDDIFFEVKFDKSAKSFKSFSKIYWAVADEAYTNFQA